MPNREVRGVMLPFYLISDVSLSMKKDGRLAAVNKIVPAVADALAENLILSDKVRFCLMDFAGEATVVLPLCDLLENTRPATLTTRRSGTSYASVFTLLRETIEKDVRMLKADGYQVHRPAVFFLSDGEPNDATAARAAAFERLTAWNPETKEGFPLFPVLVPCGVAEADADTLGAYVFPKGRSKLYMMRDGADAAQAISEMTKILIASILESGYSAVNSQSGIILPSQEQVGPDVVATDWL